MTAGGDNKLLGRVEVAAYKSDEVAAAFKVVDDQITATQPAMLKIYEDAKQAATDAQQKVDDDIKNGATPDGIIRDEGIYDSAMKYESDAERVYEYTKGACKYFAHLPTPIASVRTDSQGKYDLPLPSGDPVILAAHAARLAGDDTESYFWIVRCDPSKSTKMTLSNDDLAGSGSQDSVVKTSGVESLGEQGMPIFEAALAKALMAQYRANPASAQNAAVALYPDLGKAGTPLNKEFTARYKLYKGSKPQFFDEPDWPIRLAKECAEAMPKTMINTPTEKLPEGAK